MPRERECDYCGSDIEPGTGTMLVRTDGTTIDYCSAKCEKNADLGRESRDLEWTDTARPDEADETEADTADEAADEVAADEVEDEGEDEAEADESAEEAEADDEQEAEEEAEA